MANIIHSSLGAEPEHYKNLNLEKNHLKVREDGYRTKDIKGTYEWWYFDSQLDDGSTLVIVFHSTKWTISPNRKPVPQATFTLHTADGKVYSETVETPFSEFQAAEESCDVKIEGCQFTGNLKEYQIRFKNKTIDAKIQLTSNVPAWRPETGYIYFGNNEQHYFAWLPAVPEGHVEADVMVQGKTTHYTGTGYHDHNWGNISMLSIIKHWYWGRAKVGPYQIISSYITGEKKYGYNKFPIFMLAKNGKLIADDASNYLNFKEEDPYIDKTTGEKFYNRLIYDYNDGSKHYRVTYEREKDIEFIRAIDALPKPLQAIVKLLGMNGIYMRFTGQVTVECFERNTVIEKVSSPAIWELTAKI